MCGIAGIVDFRSPVDPHRLARMANILKHRGPDAEGFWHGRHVGLGCRRLAIVDVAHGHQPTCNEDESIHVVFNGEIYNHRELRRKLLASGHRLRSNSDVEVIPHLYEAYGPNFVDDLDGDFAIAIWDANIQRLFLTRDRVGVKPLFYHTQGDRLVFASEIKGIFASGHCDIRIDLQGLSDCFFYSHPIAPSTFWADVQDLPPGVVLSFDRGGLTQKRYFTPFARPEPDRPLIDGREAVDFSAIYSPTR